MNNEIFDYYVKRARSLEKAVRWLMLWEYTFNIMNEQEHDTMDWKKLEKIAGKEAAAKERLYLLATEGIR